MRSTRTFIAIWMLDELYIAVATPHYQGVHLVENREERLGINTGSISRFLIEPFRNGMNNTERTLPSLPLLQSCFNQYLASKGRFE